MAEVNETKKPVKNRKKTVWLIVAGAVLAVMLLAALALFCPGVSLLRTPAPASVTPPPVPEATAEPTPEATAAPVYAAGYMRCENGLFRGADTLTAGEAADAVQRAAGITLAVDDASLPLTEVSLAALLDGAFPTDAIENAMTAIAMHGGETVTRAEAAVFFDRLFSLPAADTETAFYPDVIPGEWGSGDIYTAADGAAVWDGPEGRPAEGPVLIDSQLYYAGADGYFLKNAYSGSLFFDSAGRYTSGNAELDSYVLAALREATDDSMTRDEMLRAMYLYVRDSFTYLRRHYYKTGDVGWATQEALTMYSTGRGNCYCFASAFWAAARALGFDAKIVSGTYGEEEAPHGWVEILRCGATAARPISMKWTIRRGSATDIRNFPPRTTCCPALSRASCCRAERRAHEKTISSLFGAALASPAHRLHEAADG